MGNPVKQPLFVPLGMGLKTDVDPKLLPLGKTLELQNARIQRTGEVVARPGGTNLPAPPVASWGLATRKGALVSLGVPGPSPLASYSPAKNAWLVAGGARRGPMSYADQPIASGAGSMDVAYSSGYYFLFFRDVTGTSNNCVQVAMDATTGARVFSRTVACNLGNGYRVWIANGYACFVYIQGGNVNMDAFNVAALSGTPATVASTPGAGTNRQLDLRTQGTLLQALFTNGGNIAAVDFNPATAGVTAWSPRDAAGVVIAAPTVQSWVLDFNGFGLIGFTTNAGLYFNYGTAGATRNAGTVVAAPFGANHRAITSWMYGNGVQGDVIALYDDGTALQVQATAYSAGFVVAGPNTVARSILLASKAWAYNGDYYVAVAHPSTGQFTRYVLNIPGSPVFWSSPISTVPLASIMPNDGTQNGTTFNVLSSAPSVTAASVVFGVDIARTLDGARLSGSPLTDDSIGVDLITVTHGAVPNATLGPSREAIDSLLVPGANLAAFDGAVYGQAGFAYSPDQPTLVSAAGGALTAGATYWYSIVYRYLDAPGRIWRSAPSVPKSIAMGAGTAVNLTIPTLRLTERTVSIEIYRGGANNSSTLQLVATVANSLTADTVAYGDLFSDAAIAASEVLYTTGGVQQNDTAPGFSAICIARNRHMGVPMNDPQSVWPSNEFVIGEGLRMSIENAFDVKDQYGAITALAALDDKVIIFKNGVIYSASGDGPDALGRGTFNVQLVALGIGTTNPQSVLETKDGVIFRSTSTRAGFFMLDRGLSIQYIGADVQKYQSLAISGAILLPELSQARFYTSDGSVSLVYDLVTGIWDTDTGQTANAAVAWNGRAVYASGANLVIEDATGTIWQDAGNDFSQYIESPWLQVNAAVRGFERFYRIQGVGETAGDHTLTVTLFKDFETTPFATRTLAITAAGMPRWDWELRHSMKLEALKVGITITGNTGKARISGVTLIIGAKGTLRPRALANRAT